MAGTITVDKIQSDTSYNSTINVVSALVVSNTATFSNTTTHTGAATFASTVSITGALSAAAINNSQKSLLTYLLPSTSDGWRGIYRSGFDWWSRNQQWGGPWGGEMVDTATGTMYQVEMATGYFGGTNGSGASTVGSGASTTYESQGFKVPETQTISAVWLRITKTGNPTDNFQVAIYSDSAGSPNALITNGTATAISGKTISSESAYDVVRYRFNFATPPTLTGGTQYHIVVSRSTAVNGTNYYRIAGNAVDVYPFGIGKNGNATPVWSDAGSTFWFGIELSSTAKILQSGGQFDGKLQFGGSGASGVLNMSRGLCNSVPLTNLLDTPEGTLYAVGTAHSVSTTLLDIGYGENHDRIMLYTDASGFLNAKVYDSSGVVTTVSATATDLSSGNHSIGIYWSAKGAGADRVDILVDSTTYSSSTTLSISFDKLFNKLGTMWLGGGFAIAPTYSGSSIGINGFSGLPSTLGWTYSGGATEANAFSVSGGKLYQNWNGFSVADGGRYTKAWAASNTNGYNIAVKQKVTFGTNLAGTISNSIYVEDGTKFLAVSPQEFFTSMSSTAAVYPQLDNKSYDNVNHIVTKGSDGFLFVNRKLTVDYSAAVTSADATNQLMIGDSSAVSVENADVVHSYWNYYTTAWSPPQFTSGSFSELAIWQGNMKAMWPLLYNGGTFISVKSYTGINKNYIDQSAKIPSIFQKGVVSAPTQTSSVMREANDLAAYVITEEFDASATCVVYNTAGASYVYNRILLDGQKESLIQDMGVEYLPTGGTSYTTAIMQRKSNVPIGLHKIAAGVAISSGDTLTLNGQQRSIIIRSKV